MIQHSPDKMEGTNSQQTSLHPTSSDSDSMPEKMIVVRFSPGFKKQAAFIALSITLFLAALDTVLIATALPTISSQFNINDAGYAWVGSAYLLTFAATTPSWGGISGIFGRKPVLLLANIVFLAGSVMSATANNLRMLIAGRALQGAGGGGIMTLVYICINDMFSVKERALYLGLLGMFYAVASGIGPVLGGIFTDKLNWRWCFWINLPIDGIAIALLCFFLDVHNPRTPFLQGIREIDWLGSVTVACATVMLLLGIQLGGVVFPWHSPTVILLITFGILTFGLFVAIQFKVCSSPIMPYRLFANLSNNSIFAVVILDAMVFNSVAYFLPLYLQTTLDLSPLHAGLVMLFFAVPLAIVSGSAGWLMGKTGKYIELLRGGLFLMTVGVGLCINFPEYISWPRIAFFLLIVGLGFGPNFEAPMIALGASLPAADQGAGTTVLSFFRMLSGAIGVVMGQVIFQSRIQSHLPSLTDAGVPSDMIEGLARGSAISSSKSAMDSLPEHLLILVRQAKAEGFSKVWVAYTVISFVGFLASWGIKKRVMTDQHEEFQTGLPSAQSSGSSSAESVPLNDGSTEKRTTDEIV